MEMEREPPNGSFENIINEQNHLERNVTEMLKSVELPDDLFFHEKCIYRVPHKIRRVNPEAYTPHVVSIGPIHNGDNKLKPMEEIKLQYLKSFLNKSQLSVKDCVSKLKSWEPRIRRCYADPIQHNSDDFLKIVLIDACFIIEHFVRSYRPQNYAITDPLFTNPSCGNEVGMDLLLLENQLPFFVVEGLYNLIGNVITANLLSFLDLTLCYFRVLNQQNLSPIDVRERMQMQHFTDLLRTFLLPSRAHREPPERGECPYRHLYSASQLKEAGLVFQVGTSKCILDLKFHKGVLTMPYLLVTDYTEIFMRNIVAFEQCHHFSSHYVTEYMMILDFLINTAKDVEILVENKIFTNMMGHDDAVATMVNNLLTNLSRPYISSEYRSLCDQLNAFYENPLNKYKAIFIHEYFNTPWKIASTIAAIVLLLLTLIQTVCSIMSLF